MRVHSCCSRMFARQTGLASKRAPHKSYSQVHVALAPLALRTWRMLGSSSAGDIDFNKLTVERTQHPLKRPDLDGLEFGVSFTDHLLEIDWVKATGWGAPRIRPYGPFRMDPAATALHYALQAFEGMKAYLDENKRVRLFRPHMNVERLQGSCEALAFPQFNGEHFEECLRELVRIDRDWIPDKPGYSLYIRPTVISTDPRVKVMPSGRVKLYVILCPVGPYYSGGFKPVRLYADDKHVRACEGGHGAYKLGANYGPTIAPAMEATKKGCDQILWLYGPENYVTEVGSMNQFFHWINEEGEMELITAPLTQGIILPGVTRDCILQLAKCMEGVGKVSERRFTIDEVCKAATDGRVLEAFGSGTAAIVSPVSSILFQGKDYYIPCGKHGDIGPLAKQFADVISDIQHGRVEHEWSVVIDSAKHSQKTAVTKSFMDT